MWPPMGPAGGAIRPSRSETWLRRAEVLSARAVPEETTVLAGFSQGAMLAMRIALQGHPFDCRVFIAVAPSPRETAELVGLLPGAARRGVRGI